MWPRAAAARVQIPGCWHHGTALAWQPGQENKAAPKHAAMPLPRPPTQRQAACPLLGHSRNRLETRGREVSWPRNPVPGLQGRQGPAQSHPTPDRLASGAQSQGGHAIARHIPPRPPCPHTHCCQLEQKTHPQVAMWGHAGSGPGADDRLRALLRPACRAAVGARGWASHNCLGPPMPAPAFSIRGTLPHSEAPRVKGYPAGCSGVEDMAKGDCGQLRKG